MTVPPLSSFDDNVIGDAVSRRYFKPAPGGLHNTAPAIRDAILCRWQVVVGGSECDTLPSAPSNQWLGWLESKYVGCKAGGRMELSGLKGLYLAAKGEWFQWFNARTGLLWRGGRSTATACAYRHHRCHPRTVCAQAVMRSTRCRDRRNHTSDTSEGSVRNRRDSPFASQGATAMPTGVGWR